MTDVETVTGLVLTTKVALVVPASVTIGAGTSSATFPVNTSVVVFSTTVTISASHDTETRTANLRVRSAVPGM